MGSSILRIECVHVAATAFEGARPSSSLLGLPAPANKFGATTRITAFTPKFGALPFCLRDCWAASYTYGLSGSLLISLLSKSREFLSP